MEEHYIQYTVLSVTDADADNHTDVIIRLVDYSADPITVTELTLPDTDAFHLLDFDVTYVNDIIFNGMQDVEILHRAIAIPAFISYQLILPITSNSTFGLNWTAALITINGSGGMYADYTGYDQGNRALITCNSTGFDAMLQASYDLLGTIIWDRNTGWLVSLEYAQIYDESFGFTIYHSIKPSSLPSTPLSAGVITDIFAWLGLGVGIAGLCFTIYVYKKVKRRGEVTDLE